MADETVPQSDNVIFSPNDLVAAVGLLDIAANEGAFKGWKIISEAASVRTRLLNVAEQWMKVLEAQKAFQTPSEPSSDKEKE